LGGVRAYGTVFAITTTGAESVLYSFENCIRCAFDGTYPSSALLNVSGTIYGTTYEASGGQYGTVFSITPGGVENLIAIFPYPANPLGGLIYAKGLIYYTTSAGGGSTACPNGCGTVSEIDPTTNQGGILVSFPNALTLAAPMSGLLNVGGTFYGTTTGFGYGGVFKVTSNGDETTVYAFKSGADGAIPASGLINVNGTLYGTTSAGGGSTKCQGGCGTIYKVTRAGKETVIHSFAGGTDGATPTANLLNVDGILYGTTSAGGGKGCGGHGCGTVFKISLSGAESIEHTFKGFPDGASPMAGLIKVSAKLYGTTTSGGSSANCPNGCGTVFEVKP